MSNLPEYKIESGIPIPDVGRGRGPESKYPFAKMKVGDSFFYEGSRSRLSAAAFRFCAFWKNGEKFSTRSSIENGVKGFRVWRVK